MAKSYPPVPSRPTVTLSLADAEQLIAPASERLIKLSEDAERMSTDPKVSTEDRAEFGERLSRLCAAVLALRNATTQARRNYKTDMDDWRTERDEIRFGKAARDEAVGSV